MGRVCAYAWLVFVLAWWLAVMVGLYLKAWRAWRPAMSARHWRTKNGVAACSLPATQAQLVDDTNEITCPACRKLAGLGGAA